MRLAIGLALLVLAVSLLTIMVVVLRMASRMGDETPGWARVHRHLPIGNARPLLPPRRINDSGREGGSQSRDRSYSGRSVGGLGCRVKQIESGRAGLARTAHGTSVTIARCRIHCHDISISVASSHVTLSIQVMLRWAGSR
jgi:hypothetical protein